MASGAFVFSNAEPLATAGNVWWGTEHQPAAVASEGLVSFISGPAANRWSQWSDADRNREYTNQMEWVQPGFTDAVSNTELIDWVKDHWSLGSYSFPAPGQITSQGPVLRCGVGRLHFASEHTCYPFIGYMEGALQSGVSLAKRICAQPPVASRDALNAD